MPETPTDDPFVRPFSDWLREQSAGKTLDALGQALHDLVARVRDTGKGGTMGLTIKVAPMKGNVDVLLVTDNVTVKLPAHDQKPSIFYPDQSGNLSRSDPGQLTFESLREVASVDTTTGEIREVTA